MKAKRREGCHDGGIREAVRRTQRQHIHRKPGRSCAHDFRRGNSKSMPTGLQRKGYQQTRVSRLIENVKSGPLSKVVVYKLDRISRSKLDFTEKMKLSDASRGFHILDGKVRHLLPKGRAMRCISPSSSVERETIKSASRRLHSRTSGFYMAVQCPSLCQSPRLHRWRAHLEIRADRGGKAGELLFECIHARRLLRRRAQALY